MRTFISSILALFLCFPLALARGTTVPISWHLPWNKDNVTEGEIPASAVDNTMALLNQCFEPMDLAFRAISINRYKVRPREMHSWWANPRYVNGKHARKGLLNVYTFAGDKDDPAPYRAAAPWDDLLGDKASPLAGGIKIDFNYLPGGDKEGYNTGKMFVTAVGEWAGLLRTYEGGCDGIKDPIDDLPVEASPAEGCPEGRNTCPDEPGDDPIHNLMAATNDECRTEFTKGQYERMKDLLSRYRNIRT